MAASPIEFFSNVEKNTWVHRMDPRVKIITVLTLASLPLLFTNPYFLAGWLVLFIFLWWLARIDVRPIAPLFIGGLTMVCVYIIYGSFTPLTPAQLAISKFHLSFGPFLVSDLGLLNGIILGLRMMILLMPVVLVIATTEPSQLAKAFMKMGMPVTISFIILASLRFLPLVFEVAARVMEAQRVRGLNYKTFKERINNLKFLLIPLFINTLRQSRTLGLAVESKGFGARKWKEFYREFAMTPSDWLALVVLFIFTVAVCYVRFGLNLGWSSFFVP
jgi:energy-coupling factor transport system permease protein